MTLLQKQILSMLLVIKDICQKQDIKWFLMYGTLLGAIRHNGFIPWDDDADIIMLRSEYEKFESAFNKSKYVENFSLRSVFNNADNDGQPFARFCEKSSEQLLKLNTAYSQSYGHMIDIFILDDYSNDINIQNKYKDTLAELIEVAHDRYCTSLFMNNNLDISRVILNKFKNKQKVISQYLDKLLSLGEANSELVIQRYSITHVYERSCFDKQKFILFEGESLPIPYDYTKILNIQFGHMWDEIPQNRIDHSANFVTPFDKEKFSLVESIHNKKSKFRNKLLHIAFKYLNLKYLYLDRDNWTHGRIIIESYIQSLISNNDLTKNEIIGLYLYYQLSPYFIGRLVAQKSFNMYGYRNPYIINIDDEYIILALEFLINNNQLNRASRLCELLKTFQNKEYTDDLKKILDKIVKLTCIHDDFCAQNFSQTLLKAKDYLNQYKSNLIVLKYLNMSLYFLNKRDIKDYIDLKKDNINALFYKAYDLLTKDNITCKKRGLYTLYEFIQKTNNSYLIKESLKIIDNISFDNEFNSIISRLKERIYKALGFDINTILVNNIFKNIHHKNIINDIILSAKRKIYLLDLKIKQDSFNYIFNLCNDSYINLYKLQNKENYSFIKEDDAFLLHQNIIHKNNLSDIDIYGFDQNYYDTCIKFTSSNAQYFNVKKFNNINNNVSFELNFLQDLPKNFLVKILSITFDKLILKASNNLINNNIFSIFILQILSLFRLHKLFNSFYSYLMFKNKIFRKFKIKYQNSSYAFIDGKLTIFSNTNLISYQIDKFLENNLIYKTERKLLSSFKNKDDISELSLFANHINLEDEDILSTKQHILNNNKKLQDISFCRAFINKKVNKIWEDMEFEYYKYFFLILYKDHIKKINQIMHKKDYEKITLILEPYLNKFDFYLNRGKLLLINIDLSLILIKYLKLIDKEKEALSITHVLSSYEFPNMENTSEINLEIFKERQLLSYQQNLNLLLKDYI